jgi:hypothetical protein
MLEMPVVVPIEPSCPFIYDDWLQPTHSDVTAIVIPPVRIVDHYRTIAVPFPMLGVRAESHPLNHDDPRHGTLYDNHATRVGVTGILIPHCDVACNSTTPDD